MKGLFTANATGSTSQFMSATGKILLHLAGTFGSGTAALQVQTEAGFQTIESGSWTSGPVTKIIDVPKNVICQLVLTGSTTPSLAWIIDENH